MGMDFGTDVGPKVQKPIPIHKRKKGTQFLPVNAHNIPHFSTEQQHFETIKSFCSNYTINEFVTLVWQKN